MTRYAEIISSFQNATIGVIGEMVADVYIYGFPERLSREAPVMVVRYEDERLIPGCAANTMNNLLDLGCRIIPVSVLGDDEYGRRLEAYFHSKDVAWEGIVRHPGYKTVAKTRVMVGESNRTKQQVIRIDYEPEDRRASPLEEELVRAAERVNPDVDAWLVSDYDYLPISSHLASRVLALSRDKPLVVDSHFRSRLFKGAQCMTPNEGEALEASGISSRSTYDLESIGWNLLKELDVESLLITRGNRGMMVFERSGDLKAIPTVGSDEIVDVTGAGDTVAALVTASLVCGATYVEAARLASCAASIVVMQTGAATCSIEELLERTSML